MVIRKRVHRKVQLKPKPVKSKSEEQRRRARDSYLLRTYGIDLATYERMLEEQNHGCAICDKPATLEKRAMHVDHDHVTGEIRGLLCSFCNSRFVGRFRDPERFRRASDYLTPPFSGHFAPPRKPKKRKKKNESNSSSNPRPARTPRLLQ